MHMPFINTCFFRIYSSYPITTKIEYFMSINIDVKYWIIPTISIQIQTKRIAILTRKCISRNKSSYLRIIISRSEINNIAVSILRIVGILFLTFISEIVLGDKIYILYSDFFILGPICY